MQTFIHHEYGVFFDPPLTIPELRAMDKPNYPLPAKITKIQPLKRGIAFVERQHDCWHFVVVASK